MHQGPNCPKPMIKTALPSSAQTKCKSLQMALFKIKKMKINTKITGPIQSKINKKLEKQKNV